MTNANQKMMNLVVALEEEFDAEARSYKTIGGRVFVTMSASAPALDMTIGQPFCGFRLVAVDQQNATYTFAA